MPQNDSETTFNSFQALKAVKDDFIQQKTKNKKRNKGRFDEAWQMLRQLQDLYPLTFNRNTPLPLAIGTVKEIQKQNSNFNMSTLRLALSIWTRRIEYLKAVSSGTHRHNLDGSIAAEIQSSEKDYSKELLQKKCKSKIKEQNL